MSCRALKIKNVHTQKISFFVVTIRVSPYSYLYWDTNNIYTNILPKNIKLKGGGVLCYTVLLLYKYTYFVIANLDYLNECFTELIYIHLKKNELIIYILIID